VRRLSYDLYVVDCEKMDCEECNRERVDGCTALDNDIRKNYSKVLVIERKKKVLHLCKFDGSRAEGGSQLGSKWNSIYYGKHEILCEMPDRILGAYVVGPYLSLFYADPERGVMFAAVPRLRTELEYELLHDLRGKEDLFNILQQTTRSRLSERIENTCNRTYEYLKDLIPELANETAEVISEIIGHKSSVFEGLIPILLDDEVEEVYLDSPGDNIYFDHSCFGRVLTSIVLDDGDANRLITLLRSESNLHLDRRNPSLKTSFMLLGSTLRVSVSCPPLSPDGLHMEIRKAKREPLSVIDLIRNQTISVELAALLVLATNMRMNITITGAPSSGKTTLLNALDAITPDYWRKVYIEDAIESRKVRGRHQVRIQVDPLDEVDSSLEKSVEITKSLHRSPDYLILGEIQTTEHSHALFQAISAGLRSIQTCHSDSAAGLVTRWILSHNVSKASLAMMDLIVTLKRPSPGESQRQVSEVAEILRSTQNGVLSFDGLHVMYDNSESGKPLTWDSQGSFIWRLRQDGLSDVETIHSSIIEYIKECIENKSTGSLAYLSAKELRKNLG
jgi:flagellar protein FlaI